MPEPPEVILLFDLEGIVRAVIIKDAFPIMAGIRIIAEKLFLDEVVLPGEDGKGAVYLVQPEGGLLQEPFRKGERGPFGVGIEDAGVDEAGEDPVQVIPESVPFRDVAADPVDPQLIIDILQEKVAGIEASLLSLLDQLRLGEPLDDFLLSFLLPAVKFLDVFPGPGIGIRPAGLLPDGIEVAELLYRDRGDMKRLEQVSGGTDPLADVPKVKLYPYDDDIRKKV